MGRLQVQLFEPGQLRQKRELGVAHGRGGQVDRAQMAVDERGLAADGVHPGGDTFVGIECRPGGSGVFGAHASGTDKLHLGLRKGRAQGIDPIAGDAAVAQINVC